MFSDIKIFTAAFVVFVVLVMMAGCLLSENLADTDLFNPQRHGAEAEDMLADTDWEKQKRELQLPLLNEEMAAEHKLWMAQREAEVEITRAQTDQKIWEIEQFARNNVEHQQELMRLEQIEKQQKIENSEQLAEAGILILKIFGITMAVALAGCVMVTVIRRALPDQPRPQAAPAAQAPPRPFTQNWENPGYRQNRIHQARHMEREIRKLQLDGKQPDSKRREIYPWRT